MSMNQKAFMMVSVIMLFMSIYIACNCDDIAKALNTGGIACQDGEHGSESIYMSSSKHSSPIRLSISFTCENGKSVFEVRP